MTKRSWIILAVLLLVSGAVLIYGIRNEAQQKNAINKTDSDGTESLVYGAFFRKMAAFYAEADETERRGGDGRFLRDHYKSTASLNDEQASLLDRIVRDFIREKAIIDARQKAIVEVSRAPYPDGLVPNGQSPPPQPAELRELALERNQLYLRMREQLKNTFGDEEFARFDAVIRKKIISNTNPFVPDKNEEKP